MVSAACDLVLEPAHLHSAAFALPSIHPQVGKGGQSTVGPRKGEIGHDRVWEDGF